MHQYNNAIRPNIFTKYISITEPEIIVLIFIFVSEADLPAITPHQCKGKVQGLRLVLIKGTVVRSGFFYHSMLSMESIQDLNILGSGSKIRRIRHKFLSIGVFSYSAYFPSTKLARHSCHYSCILPLSLISDMYYTGNALFKKVNDFPVSSRDVIN